VFVLADKDRAVFRMKRERIVVKNHSEKVYFFGVVFLCAILPYFVAFASTFLKIFIQCAQKTLYSHKVYFLRMAVLIVCESSVDGKNRKSLRRLIQGTAPPEIIFEEAKRQLCWELFVDVLESSIQTCSRIWITEMRK